MAAAVAPCLDTHGCKPGAHAVAAWMQGVAAGVHRPRRASAARGASASRDRNLPRETREICAAPRGSSRVRDPSSPSAAAPPRAQPRPICSRSGQVRAQSGLGLRLGLRLGFGLRAQGSGLGARGSGLSRAPCVCPRDLPSGLQLLPKWMVRTHSRASSARSRATMASAGASGVSRKETQWRSRPGGGGG